jgi:hypothetical protein
MYTDIPDKPNGPAAAALLAGGLGSGIFGLIVLFSEINESFGQSLNWYNPVTLMDSLTFYVEE